MREWTDEGWGMGDKGMEDDRMGGDASSLLLVDGRRKWYDVVLASSVTSTDVW